MDKAQEEEGFDTQQANDVTAIRDMEEDNHQFLTFTLGEEEFGVDIMMVREVKGWTQTTRLPNKPAFLRGVLNLRGTIIPIFDLRARFGGPLTQTTVKHVVVIVAVKERTIGILVDTVSDILTVSNDMIRDVPSVEEGRENAFVSGLIGIENRMVVLLDMDRLVDLEVVTRVIEEASSNEGVSEGAVSPEASEEGNPADEPNDNNKSNDISIH